MEITLRNSVALKNINTSDFDDYTLYDLILSNDTINKNYVTNTYLNEIYYILVNGSYIIQPVGTEYNENLDYYKNTAAATEDPKYVLVSKNNIRTYDDGLRVQLSPEVVQLHAEKLQKDSNGVPLSKSQYYIGLSSKIGTTTQELIINDPNNTDMTLAFEKGHYVNSDYQPYVQTKTINDTELIIIDFQSIFEDSAIVDGETYQGIQNLSSNPYYQGLNPSSQAAFASNLKLLYDSWGLALRELTTLFEVRLYIKTDETYITVGPYLINTQWGASDTAARLNINKYDITASVANGIMRYSEDGLDILTTGKDEGIRIFKGNYDNPVFYADESGNLTLKGYVYAEGGVFNGTVYATDGSFTGSVYATKGGSIGSLVIDTEGVQIGASTNYLYMTSDGIKSYTRSGEESSANGNLIINTDGSIYAKNLKLGESATIDDYLLIGNNCYIYNPLKHNNNFIVVKEIDDDGNVTTNDAISILSNGTGHFGDIYFDGNESSIRSAQDISLTTSSGWSLTPDTATFNNIVATGKITTAVFEAERTSLSGSAFIYKGGLELEDFTVYVASDEYYYTIYYDTSGDKLLAIVNDEVKYVGTYPDGHYELNGVTVDINDYLVSSAGYIGDNNIYCVNNGTLVFSSEEKTEDYLNITRQTIVFKPVKKYGDDFIDGHLYYITNNYRESGFFAIYEADTQTIRCVTSTLPNGTYNLAIDLGVMQNDVIDDWFIGINSSGNNIAGLSKNGITLSEVSYYDNDYHIDPKIILGQIPKGILDFEDGESQEAYGLYAQSVYLTGTLTTRYTVDGDYNYAGINTLSAVPFIDPHEGDTQNYTEVSITEEEFEANKYYIYNEVSGKYQLAQVWDADETYYVKADPDSSPIIFWAGATGTTRSAIQAANFQVTSNGTIYAKQGYFEGSIFTKAEIEAKTLRVSTIYGKEDGTALNIQDADIGIKFSDTSGNLILQADDSQFYLNTPLRFEHIETLNTVAPFDLLQSRMDASIITVRNTYTIDDSGYGVTGQGTIVILPTKLCFFNSYEEDLKIFNTSYEPDPDFSLYTTYDNIDKVNKLKFDYESNNIFNIQKNRTQVTNKFQVAKELSFGDFDNSQVEYILPRNQDGYGIDIYIYE